MPMLITLKPVQAVSAADGNQKWIAPPVGVRNLHPFLGYKAWHHTLFY